MASIRSSEITPRHVYLDRRAFMKASAIATIGAACTQPLMVEAQGAGRKLEGVRKIALITTEALNSYEHVTSL
jgi:hypothetical protein